MKAKLKDRDLITVARRVAETAIGEHMDGSALEVRARSKNPAAVSRGRLGGLKGGHARAFKLSAKTLGFGSVNHSDDLIGRHV
jgi:hypothetical protein